MNIPAIMGAVRGWVALTTGLADGKIINAYQDAPRPSPPYAVVYRPLAIMRRGVYDEERIDSDADGVITRFALRHLTIRVDVFGSDAVSLAHDACAGLDRYDVRDILAAQCLSVVSQGEVRNLTGLLQSRYEERAQFDPVFALADTSTETVGYIETVTGTATYDDGEPVPYTIE